MKELMTAPLSCPQQLSENLGSQGHKETPPTALWRPRALSLPWKPARTKTGRDQMGHQAGQLKAPYKGV